jgi:hypothetical protein
MLRMYQKESPCAQMYSQSFSPEAGGTLFVPLLAARGGPVETLATKAFSLALRPKERTFVLTATDFLESFNDISNNSSLSDVLSPVWDEAPLHLFAPQDFLGTASTSDLATALHFLDPRAAGLGHAMYFTPSNSNTRLRRPW